MVGILKEYTKNFLQVVISYWGKPHLLVIILILTALILFCFRKREEGKRMILFYIIMLAGVFNPIVYGLFWTKIMRSHLYWRMIWLLPTVILLAWAICAWSKKLSGNKKSLPLFIGIAFVLLFGKNVYMNDNFQWATNKFKLPQDVVSTAAAILENGGKAKAVVPDELCCYTRQYSTKIDLLYGRDIYGYTSPIWDEKIHKIHEEMNKEDPDMDYLTKAVREYECNYIILSQEKVQTDSPESFGFTCAGKVGGYMIYKDEMEKR